MDTQSGDDRTQNENDCTQNEDGLMADSRQDNGTGDRVREAFKDCTVNATKGFLPGGGKEIEELLVFGGSPEEIYAASRKLLAAERLSEEQIRKAAKAMSVEATASKKDAFLAGVAFACRKLQPSGEECGTCGMCGMPATGNGLVCRNCAEELFPNPKEDCQPEGEKCEQRDWQVIPDSDCHPQVSVPMQDGDIVPPFNDEKTVTKCRTCKGTGKLYLNHHARPCPDCNGTGQRQRGEGE